MNLQTNHITKRFPQNRVLVRWLNSSHSGQCPVSYFCEYCNEHSDYP